jgi:hypothetical protein
MYIRAFSLLLLFSTFLFRISSAQVGINTDDPNSSAILEIYSNDKGVLFPKITDTSSLNVTNGLFYYNGNNNRFYYYNASKSNWQCINPLNSTDPSQITASNNLKVNSDLTVKNNQTVKNKLTVEDILEVTNVMEANQSIITLKKKVDLNDEMSVQNNFTVEQGEVNVNNGDISVNNGYRIKGKGSIPKGTILMWKGNTSQNFNSSGKGINDLEGWAICNGNTHGTFTTPNLTDRFIKAGTQSSLGTSTSQHRNDPYYIDVENGCEPWQNKIVIKLSYTTAGPTGGDGSKQDTIKAHNYKRAVSIAGWNTCPEDNYTNCSTEFIKKIDNPDYYRSKNSCKTSNQVDTDYYSLLFIIRI